MYHKGFYNNKKTKPQKTGIQKRIPLEQRSYQTLVKLLDHEFSVYRRLVDADYRGYVRCCTCGAPFFWKEIDCGHYISRAIKLTRWEVKNTSPQCKKCNRYLNGQPHLFRQYLVDRYGLEEVKRIELFAQGKNCLQKDSIIGLIYFYKEKNKELKKEKGLK